MLGIPLMLGVPRPADARSKLSSLRACVRPWLLDLESESPGARRGRCLATCSALGVEEPLKIRKNITASCTPTTKNDTDMARPIHRRLVMAKSDVGPRFIAGIPFRRQSIGRHESKRSAIDELIPCTVVHTVDLPTPSRSQLCQFCIRFFLFCVGETMTTASFFGVTLTRGTPPQCTSSSNEFFFFDDHHHFNHFFSLHTQTAQKQRPPTRQRPTNHPNNSQRTTTTTTKKQPPTNFPKPKITTTNEPPATTPTADPHHQQQRTTNNVSRTPQSTQQRNDTTNDTTTHATRHANFHNALRPPRHRDTATDRAQTNNKQPQTRRRSHARVRVSRRLKDSDWQWESHLPCWHVPARLVRVVVA